MKLRALWGRDETKTVFVLGGGGNLGAVQVGMLRALLAHDIRPDAVVGCSVGSVNGAMLAAEPTREGVDRLAELWANLTSDTLCPHGLLSSAMHLTRRGQSLHGNETLRSLLIRSLPIARFEDAPVPLHLVTTVLRTGEARWFSQGDLIEPLLASCALPGVLPPVEVDEELLIDGGVVDNVPVTRGLALGATRLVVLHAGNFFRERGVPRRPIEMLVRAMSIGRSARFGHDIEAVPHHVELVVPPSIDPGRLRYNDFSQSSSLIQRAEDATLAYLEQTMPGLARPA